MKKIIVVIFFMLFLGCSGNHSEKNKTHRFDIICLDGVQYWQKIGGFLAPKFNIDGTVVICK